MAAPPIVPGVRVPPGSLDWLVPLADPRARILRNAGVTVASLSEVKCGFYWAGPGVNHLVIGSIAGSGTLEADGVRHPLPPGALMLSRAGVPRRLASKSASWKLIAIRLADVKKWQHLIARGVHALPHHWLARILAPVDGMLAEQPSGRAIEVSTQAGNDDEQPLDYLTSRHAARIVGGDVSDRTGVARGDAFELHALILRQHLESMLAADVTARTTDTEVALASLWSRVIQRPRGPWDADDLAAVLGVSRTTLYRLVKQQHGTSPAKVVERLRMDVACGLLSTSPHTIEVVADQVGYASAFSFSAAFKRVIGESPSTYRKRPPEKRRKR